MLPSSGPTNPASLVTGGHADDACAGTTCATDHGVTTDGMDSSAALIAAIAYAVANNLELVLPAGTINTGSTPITTPAADAGKLRIRGAGKGITRISRTAGVAATVLDIRFTGAGLVELRDFTIDGPTGLAPDNRANGILWITGGLTHRFRVERVEVTGTLDHALQNSGGGRVELIDFDGAATNVVVAMFESTNTPNSAFLHARGGLWQTPNGDLTTQGSVGLYIHPHLPYLVEGVTFATIGRYAIYQNGSPGSARQPALAVGCRMINCELAQTKTTGISNFVGCVLKGTSSRLGSSLAGRVNIDGCTFEDAAPIAFGPAPLTSQVQITGCLFVDTSVWTCGHAANHWQLRDCTFVVTNAAFVPPPPADSADYRLRAVNGLTDLENVLFVDETTTLKHHGFVGMTSGGSSTVRARGCTFRGGRGTLTGGFVFNQATGSLTIDGCEFDPGTPTTVINLGADITAGSLEGSGNRFRNGATISGADTHQHRLTRRHAVNPHTVASAANISTTTTDMLDHDTHIVTGTAAITKLTDSQKCVGILRLVVAAGASWSTANTGNIHPKTTAPRTPGDVVTLLFDPMAGKWLEV